MFWLVLAFLFVLGGAQVAAEGFLAGTLVKTAQGSYAAIETLAVGDLVISPDLQGADHVQKIARVQKIVNEEAQVVALKSAHEAIQKSTRNSVVFVSIGGDVVGMAPDQLLYCTQHEQWVTAQDGAESGVCAHLFDDIWVQDYDEPVTFYIITLDTATVRATSLAFETAFARDPSRSGFPYFYVTSHDLVVHNAGPAVVLIPGLFATAAAAPPVAIVGTAIGIGWCIKKLVDELRFRSRDWTKDSSQSRSEQEFDKNYQCPYHQDCHRPHPHGLFVGVDYHGKEQIGRKSPGPRDGQLALDFSVKADKKGKSKHRIGLSYEQIVVLLPTGIDPRTGREIWHGYVVTWDTAGDFLQEALKEKAGQAAVEKLGGLIGLGKLRKGSYMQENKIVLRINDREEIRISLLKNVQDVFRYDDAAITYRNNNSGLEYVLYENDIVLLALDSLSNSFAEQSRGGLKEYPLTVENVGYLWNEQLHSVENSDLEYELDDEGTMHWVGKRFFLWNARGIATWFYEKDGKIFLEITPVYKWHFKFPKLKEIFKYTSYETFKKSYTPHVSIELNEQVLHQWKKQVDSLMAIIARNDKKYFFPTLEEAGDVADFCKQREKDGAE